MLLHGVFGVMILWLKMSLAALKRYLTVERLNRLANYVQRVAVQNNPIITHNVNFADLPELVQLLRPVFVATQLVQAEAPTMHLLYTTVKRAELQVAYSLVLSWQSLTAGGDPRKV